MAGIVGKIIEFGFEYWYMVLFIFMAFTLFVVFKIRTMGIMYD